MSVISCLPRHEKGEARHNSRLLEGFQLKQDALMRCLQMERLFQQQQ